MANVTARGVLVVGALALGVAGVSACGDDDGGGGGSGGGDAATGGGS